MKLYKYEDEKCNASGSKIRELRESLGWSQEQLAARLQLIGLNLNQKAISRIETGDRVVPDFELPFFSQVLNVPLCKLLGIEKDKCLYIQSPERLPRHSNKNRDIDDFLDR